VLVNSSEFSRAGDLASEHRFEDARTAKAIRNFLFSFTSEG
jgi:hypothetical protein